MKTLRPYQDELSNEGVIILLKKKIVIYAMQVRTGKTAVALNTAKLYGAKNVLFLTKKKAISSIEEDFVDFRFNKSFNITVANNESLHKVVGDFDLVVMDESHRFGSYPKPSKGAKDFKLRFSRLPIILLSGTLTPESHSQIYHQLWISSSSPFPEATFYKWANRYVQVTQKNLGYGLVNDYSKAIKEKIDEVVNPYILTFTQEQAGFSTEVKETVLFCPMSDTLNDVIRQLKRDLVIQGKDELIMADTAVKLMSKLHQLEGGTIKFESGNSKVLDFSKAIYIKNKFEGKKLGIFYKFKAELTALKEVYGDDLTTDLEEFNATDKSIALQFLSGREGISLRAAKCLVYYNIDYSATTYFQAKDRLTTMDRLSNDVYYVLAEKGLGSQVLKQVQAKKNFTLSYFKKLL